MAKRQPNSIFRDITPHLPVALGIISVVLTLVACLALGIFEPWAIFTVLSVTVLTVFVASALVIVAIALFVDVEPVERAIDAVVRAFLPRKQVSTGIEGLIEARGTVIEPFEEREAGNLAKVRIGPEIWAAELASGAEKVPITGDKVEVTDIDGLRISVRRWPEK